MIIKYVGEERVLDEHQKLHIVSHTFKAIDESEGKDVLLEWKPQSKGSRYLVYSGDHFVGATSSHLYLLKNQKLNEKGSIEYKVVNIANYFENGTRIVTW